jgi:FAD/FMN-containing dehydrogenase
MAISIPDLRTTFDGRVVAPEDAGYDEARTLFYGGFDHRPAVIIRPTDASEVARVVSLARDTGLDLAIRSGAHSLAGHSISDGGIVLDLGEMRRIEIDAERRTAWAETGATAAEVTTASGAHGLAVGFGDTGSVGIGGITLGGGVGFLSRKYGLTIDSLLGQMWSPPRASSSAWMARRTRTCSGPSGVAAATSVWPPGSCSASIRWTGSWAACCSSRLLRR